MLRELNKEESKILVACSKCDNDFQSSYKKGEYKEYIPDFKEHKNYTTYPCPNCGTVEIFNLNIPEYEMSEEYFDEIREDMSESERKQRRILKEFISEFNFE